MLEMTFLLPTCNRGVLPTQTSVHYSRCCKRLFSCQLERGESYPLKLRCMTLDVADELSPASHRHGGDLETLTLVQDCRCCKRLFFCPLASRDSYPPKLQCITLDVANKFLHPSSKGGVFPKPTLVHDCSCCK